MSLTSPPGCGRRWPQLLAYIIDDEGRTRRANLLLRQITACLLVVSAMAVTVTLLVYGRGWYTGATGSAGVLLVWLARIWQRRVR